MKSHSERFMCSTSARLLRILLEAFSFRQKRVKRSAVFLAILFKLLLTTLGPASLVHAQDRLLVRGVFLDCSINAFDEKSAKNLMDDFGVWNAGVWLSAGMRPPNLRLNEKVCADLSQVIDSKWRANDPSSRGLISNRAHIVSSIGANMLTPKDMGQWTFWNKELEDGCGAACLDKDFIKIISKREQAYDLASKFLPMNLSPSEAALFDDRYLNKKGAKPLFNDDWNRYITISITGIAFNDFATATALQPDFSLIEELAVAVTLYESSTNKESSQFWRSKYVSCRRHLFSRCRKIPEWKVVLDIEATSLPLTTEEDAVSYITAQVDARLRFMRTDYFHDKEWWPR